MSSALLIDMYCRQPFVIRDAVRRGNFEPVDSGNCLAKYSFDLSKIATIGSLADKSCIAAYAPTKVSGRVLLIYAFRESAMMECGIWLNEHCKQRLNVRQARMLELSLSKELRQIIVWRISIVGKTELERGSYCI